jgi:hypothetical protein
MGKNRNDFEEKLILSKQINEELKPIVKERELQKKSERVEIEETISTTINDLREKIRKLKDDKEKTIKAILGQMYKGVIIPQELTIRKGKFYRYRCQYELDLTSIKQSLMRFLSDVTEKLTERNLDIMEFVLDKVEERSHYYRNNEDKQSRDYDFEELFVVEFNDEDIKEKEFSIYRINGVNLNDEGDLKFYYKTGNQKEFVNLQEENYNQLYQKFREEIDKLGKEFVEELQSKIDTREEELKIIKEKGSNQLMVVELERGTENINGWGEE